MRDSTTLFDHDADPDMDGDDELTREFWGASASWVARDRNHDRGRAFQLQRADESTQALRLDHTPASMRAVREGIAAFRPKRRWRDDSTGSIERTREHGVVNTRTAAPLAETSPPPTRRRPSPDHLPHRDASIAELAAGQFDGPRHESGRTPHDANLEPTTLIGLTPSDSPLGARLGLAGVDPLLVRLGFVLLALLLAIPLALSLRDDGNGAVGTTSITVAPADAALGLGGAEGDAILPTRDGAAATDSLSEQPATPAAPVSEDGSVAANPDAATEAVAPTPAPSSDSTSSDTATNPAASDAGSSTADDTTRAAALTESEDLVISDDDAATETAELAIPDCSLSYTAGAGDSWYRIADAAGVTPTALLDQNRATTDTVILPGDEVCLPQGATVPSAPTTTPATTAAPTTTQEPTTTQAPTTTAAPAAAPPAPASTAEVQALIREIWPDELEERALEIAWRESNHRADADNGWCCVGVFQLYWTVHRGWLDDYGISTRNDLMDARKNITAAYALYQRSGGWGPWSTA